MRQLWPIIIFRNHSIGQQMPLSSGRCVLSIERRRRLVLDVHCHGAAANAGAVKLRIVRGHDVAAGWADTFALHIGPACGEIRRP